MRIRGRRPWDPTPIRQMAASVQQTPAEWRVQLRFVHDGVEWYGYTPDRYESHDDAEGAALDLLGRLDGTRVLPLWLEVQGEWGGTWSYRADDVVGVGVFPVGMFVSQVPA